MKTAILALLSLLAVVTSTNPALAAVQSVGKVVALRGKATIERKGTIINAAVRNPVEADDSFRTEAASRAKLLFVDDSVLTLGENTRMSIREFVHEKGKGGKSVFNLIDGKMRTVVGKTRFEVQTPTAVAAARGTVIYFEVGRFNNQDFSRILCLEGKVDVRSSSPTIQGGVTLTPGTMVVVTTNKPVPPPVQAPQLIIDNARIDSSSGNQNQNQDSGPPPPPPPPPQPLLPPVIPPAQPSKVNIRINTP
jgi:ferric-dicitrate binding protein FerR (iron transport regulator)